MRINKIALTTLLTLVFIAPIIALAEYRTKSQYSDDYKCVSDKQGGFNHNATGHDLALFKGEKEFFLTHISNIPDEAITDYKKNIHFSVGKYIMTDKLSEIRQFFEERNMKQENIHKINIEKSSYFIRKADENPKKYITYLVNGCRISQPQSKAEEPTIACYESSQSKIFNLDLKTMRFTYSYVGTWHKKRENKYYGDSSVFAFGVCRKYLR